MINYKTLRKKKVLKFQMGFIFSFYSAIIWVCRMILIKWMGILTKYLLSRGSSMYPHSEVNENSRYSSRGWHVLTRTCLQLSAARIYMNVSPIEILAVSWISLGTMGVLSPSCSTDIQFTQSVNLCIGSGNLVPGPIVFPTIASEKRNMKNS